MQIVISTSFVPVYSFNSLCISYSSYSSSKLHLTCTKPQYDMIGSTSRLSSRFGVCCSSSEMRSDSDPKYGRERYMGRWYEIASFPSRFQPKDGVNTRATYTLKEHGTVNVLNETWSGGKRSYIEGSANKADPKSDEAKLKVKFYVPPFLPVIPVVGDYWVLYIDNYQYALIGQPIKRYLWILSRKTHIDDEIYNQLVQRARDEGYDLSNHKTPQSDPPPEGEEGLKDTKGIWWIKSVQGY